MFICESDSDSDFDLSKQHTPMSRRKKKITSRKKSPVLKPSPKAGPRINSGNSDMEPASTSTASIKRGNAMIRGVNVFGKCVFLLIEDLKVVSL